LLHDLLPDAKLVGLLQNPGQTPASILPRGVPSSNRHETPRGPGAAHSKSRTPAPMQTFLDSIPLAKEKLTVA
jgi:hypothetical protein